MSVTTTKYIRKPLYVEAVRVTEANFDDVAAWCQGAVLQDELPDQGTGKKYIRVRVNNPKNPRQTKAFVGDWLLYTERGYKVYTNKAFHTSFDGAEEESDNGKTLPAPVEIMEWLNAQPEFVIGQFSELVQSGKVCSSISIQEQDAAQTA